MLILLLSLWEWIVFLGDLLGTVLIFTCEVDLDLDLLRLGSLASLRLRIFLNDGFEFSLGSIMPYFFSIFQIRMLLLIFTITHPTADIITIK